MRGDVARTEVHRIGFALCELDELRQRFCLHTRVHGHDVRLLDQLADADKIPGHVKAEFGHQCRCHGGGADFRDHHGITVGIGGGGDCRAERALGAAAVIEQNLLAEVGAQGRLHDPRHQVSATTGREWHDQADRFVGVGIALGGHGRRCQCQARSSQRQAKKSVHQRGSSLSIFLKLKRHVIMTW